MNQGLPTYSNFVSSGNRQISAKYVVNNLVMCENRVNTHSHRAYFTNYFLNIKALASRVKKKFFIYSSEEQQCFYAIPYCIISAAVHSLHLQYTCNRAAHTCRAVACFFMNNPRKQQTFMKFRKVKSTLLLLALMLVTPLCGQEAATVIGRISLSIGATDNPSATPLLLSLHESTVPLTAAEIYILLPQNATLTTNATPEAACSATHEITEGNTPDGYFVSIASPMLDTFNSSDTLLCRWQCDLSSLPEGTYTIQGKGVFAVGAEENIECYATADINERITIRSGSVTAIEHVESDSNTPGVIYNLQGQRLPQARRGAIYIINGKKVKL